MFSNVFLLAEDQTSELEDGLIENINRDMKSKDVGKNRQESKRHTGSYENI